MFVSLSLSVFATYNGNSSKKFVIWNLYYYVQFQAVIFSFKKLL